jgi:hypothetical protein
MVPIKQRQHTGCILMVLLADMLAAASDLVGYWLSYSRRTVVNIGGTKNEAKSRRTKFEMHTQYYISIKPE